MMIDKHIFYPSVREVNTDKNILFESLAHVHTKTSGHYVYEYPIDFHNSRREAEKTAKKYCDERNKK